ncbi:cyclin-dependent kinase inhibitor 7 isoform X2 [Jatropha curcas]|uniref:cyclin-dependent kinase inhibitor 7 isoform X2 n=1 Tax=Jatropha curcas TaxID=180498 RepID=UPI0009D7326A|nr:cyclin-dependent kinase inhibitor 7 isoform X2 [Jatropha curcas]
MRDSNKRRAAIQAMKSSTTNFSKKMKIDSEFSFEEFKLPSWSYEIQDNRFYSISSPYETISTLSSSNSGGFLADDLYSVDSEASHSSFCIESSVIVKDSSSFVDLKVKSFETESSSFDHSKFRETTPSSEFQGDTDEMDAPAAKGKSGRKCFQSEKMPTQAEIDEFFAEAEKKEQKRFAEKYNYDVAKDVPLEGRYQWVRLKP